jgi:soluble lytic murein transglycosylase
MDEMLWQGETAAIDRMMQRVPEGWQRLAAARRALAARADGVDARIAAVPDDLRGNAGLAYERFNWRARKGRNSEAIALLAERSRSPELLGQPEKWANWRRIYARQLMRDGQYDEAYSIASLHFLVEGSHFADLEWLSGYLALRFLADPELALLHFDRFQGAVASPISLGRAGYWKGRAWAALGDTEAAAVAYAAGAEHQTSFYGLLAAEAAGLPLDPTLAGTETFPPLAETGIGDSSVLEAGLLLLDAGDLNLAERFLTHLVEGKPREESGSLAAEILDRGEPHVALMIAKRTARESIVLPAAYFPLSPLMERELPVSKALALAIARRESEFDPVVVSPAGARGLMQLMPGTASDVSDDLGISYSRERLTSDPGYNVRLGSSYLAGLTETFGPAPVLVTVGYNAGPGRSRDWLRRYGDPRRRSVDVIDWIEGIPFRETRNYVMRVTESVINYRARLGDAPVGPVAITDYLYDG